MGLKLFVFLFLLVLGISTPAQIIHEPGQPPGWQKSANTAPLPSFSLPQIDLAAVAQEDAQNDATKTGPFRFAIPFATNINPSNNGLWSSLANGGRVWQMRLASAGALNLNVIFSKFTLLPGEQVFLYSENRQDVIGPLTARNNKSWGSLATRLIEGESMIVEYYIPDGAGQTGQLEIGQVAHGYRGLGASGLGDSDGCNNNVVCPEWTDWTCQTRSVVMLLEGGSDFCTGTLINNLAQDGRPLILTAEHCTDNTVPNWVFMFNWTSPTCNQTTNNSRDMTVSGSTLLVQDRDTDFALLEMSEAPPASYNAFYTGWDATGRTPQSQVSIHHPSGDIMKISLDEDPAQKSGGIRQVWEVVWEDGTTEPGSSGSGLWDENYRLIGQLFGGGASCSNMNSSDDYGRLEISWDLGASEYLDPDNTGMKTVDGLGSGACSGTAAFASFSVGNSNTCAGGIQFANQSQNAASYSWNFGDGNTSTSENPFHQYTTSGEFTVTLNITGNEGDNDSYQSTIVVSPVAASVIKGDTVCATYTALLHAGTLAGITVDWYQNQSDVTPVFTGNTLTLPNLTQARQYYVDVYDSKSVLKVGPETNSFGDGENYTNSNDHGLYFNVEAALDLKSVKVFAGSSGERTVELQNLSESSEQTKTFDLTNGEQRIDLDWSLEPGNYFLTLSSNSDIDLFRNSSGPDYPYSIPGLISINRSSATSSELDYYYFFYDWEVQEHACHTGKLPVDAAIESPCVTSAQPLAGKGKMQLMQGPGLNKFLINSPVKIAASVYNTAGQLVFTKQLYRGKNILDFEGLTSGLYILRFSENQFPSQNLFIP